MSKSFPKPKKRKKPINRYKIVRASVVERDSGLCRICGKVAVDTHHIIFRKYGKNSAQNLICVCRNCHTTIHGNNKHWFKILFNMQKEIYPELTKEMLKK